jgi:hypothetical protein
MEMVNKEDYGFFLINICLFKISKANDFLKVGETINDVILTESSKTWKKKSSSSSKITDVPARILAKHERILEVIDRVGRETVILCKKKAQTQVEE